MEFIRISMESIRIFSEGRASARPKRGFFRSALAAEVEFDCCVAALHVKSGHSSAGCAPNNDNVKGISAAC